MKKDKKFNKSNPSIKNEKTKPYMKPSLVEEKKNKAPEQPKVTISEKVQNLPFMVRKAEENKMKAAEGIKKKILESYQWHYRKLPDQPQYSPSSSLTSETIHRYSFGGFHPQLEEMVKERQQWKDGTYKEADIDIGTDTEKIFKRYKTVKKSKSGYKK